jgi:hypothetical protein
LSLIRAASVLLAQAVYGLAIPDAQYNTTGTVVDIVLTQHLAGSTINA